MNNEGLHLCSTTYMGKAEDIKINEEKVWENLC